MLNNSPKMTPRKVEREIISFPEMQPGGRSSTAEEDSTDDSDGTSGATTPQEHEEPIVEETESEAFAQNVPALSTPLLYRRALDSIRASIAKLNLVFIFFLLLMIREGAFNIYVKIGFYGCLIAMMWCTCDILQTRQPVFEKFISSGFFANLDHRSSYVLLDAYLQPYVSFFCALISNMFISSLIPSARLPHLAINIFSMIFVFISFVGFLRSPARASIDVLVFVSLGANVLAKYLYELDDDFMSSCAYPNSKVPIFHTFVFGNVIKLCVNCRAALYLLISILLVHLARRCHWHGIYMYLLPHCVTLGWLRLGITAFQRAIIFRLVRTSLLLSCFWTFLTIFELVCSLIPILVFFNWMGIKDPDMYIVATLSVATVTMAFFCYLSVDRTLWKPIIVFQVVLCILNICLLNFPYIPAAFKASTNLPLDERASMYKNISETVVLTQSCDDNNYSVTPEVTSPLNWERFNTLYGAADVEEQNKIQGQFYCSHLNGIGNIAQLRIDSVTNVPLEHIAGYLLDWLGDVLRCFYDTQLKEELAVDDHNPTCSEMEELVQSTHLVGSCWLEKSNKYECEIRFRLTELGFFSKTIHGVVRACYQLKTIPQDPAFGERIQFYEMKEGLVQHSNNAHMQLLALSSPLCENEAIISLNMERLSVGPRICGIMSSIKYILEVVFNPLITIKTPLHCF